MQDRNVFPGMASSISPVSQTRTRDRWNGMPLRCLQVALRQMYNHIYYYIYYIRLIHNQFSIIQLYHKVLIQQVEEQITNQLMI